MGVAVELILDENNNEEARIVVGSVDATDATTLDDVFANDEVTDELMIDDDVVCSLLDIYSNADGCDIKTVWNSTSVCDKFKIIALPLVGLLALISLVTMCTCMCCCTKKPTKKQYAKNIQKTHNKVFIPVKKYKYTAIPMKA